ncbi:MAG: VWA domain-containing protein [Bryobacter sp.]|nr:VWA domain-containing protein [Bryobacter sp.]
MRRTLGFALALAGILLAPGASAQESTSPPTPPPIQEPEVVFRGGVSLARIDVQVLDRNRRAVTGLRAEDFELLVNGQPTPIANFATEEVPLDVLILLDVSGSMRPHVELVGSAMREALYVLGRKDRVALMVFDRRTRLSMPYRGDHDDIVRGMQALLDQEDFNGGTDITRAFYDSIQYVRTHARPEARKAIVILTDDRTERNRDVRGIGRALSEGGIVVSALIAPDALGNRRVGRGPVSIGTSWPDIIFGPGSRRNRIPGGGQVGGLSNAGTSEIAINSGGDSYPARDASALENALEKLRQSYALYYSAPTAAGDNVEVQLSARAEQRYPGVQLNYRRAAQSNTADSAPDDSWRPTKFPSPPPADPAPTTDTATSAPKRRPAVDDPSSTTPLPTGEDASGEKKGGFRRLKPGEKP